MKKIKLYFSLILLLTFYPVYDIYGVQNRILYISCVYENGYLIIKPLNCNNTQVIIPKSEAESGFNYLYYCLENRIYNSKFKLTQKVLSDKIVKPLQNLLNESDEIVFVIQQDIITYPFDILLINNDYLFTSKPISYSFNETRIIKNSINKMSYGLIISDPTADPENGCYTTKKIFPQSAYFLDKDYFSYNFEKEDYFNFVLISAHGQISLNDSDHFILNGNNISFNKFKIKHDLMYFDSCRLGISYRFIENSAKLGAQYYLAPITSNEAGNSSTKTIQYFFKNINHGYSVTQSLFKTRKKIFNDYVDKESIENVLWYSFPFRVYLLKN